MRLSDARLHAELSRCMYSLHGLEPLMRPVLAAVCQRLMVVSNCRPGSAHSHAAVAIWRNRSRALSVRTIEPSMTARRCQSASSSTACMNSSVRRTELLAFWYWMENESLPSRSMSNPASRSTRALFSSLALHQMNSSTSGWFTSSMTILAARRVLPPDLIVPAEASAPRMNDTGPEAVPPPASSSLLERMRDRFTPAPEPPLKMMPSSRYQFRMEFIESSTARMKQALACCGTPLTPMLNHTGELNATIWMHEEVLQLGVERLGLGGVHEVAALGAPAGDRCRPPGPPLGVATTPRSGVPKRAPEVLLGDDVGGVQRPPDREFHTQLLEGHRTVAVVGDAGVTALPRHVVVRMRPRAGCSGGGSRSRCAPVRETCMLRSVGPGEPVLRGPRPLPATDGGGGRDGRHAFAATQHVVVRGAPPPPRHNL